MWQKAWKMKMRRKVQPPWSRSLTKKKKWGDQPPDDEEAAEDDEDNRTSGEMEEGELKEAFAAGWKAKQKVADFKKQRGWKATDKKGEKGASSTTIDARKKATTCSSCGRQGHWRGDPEFLSMSSMDETSHTTRRHRWSTSLTWFPVETHFNARLTGLCKSPPSFVESVAALFILISVCQGDPSEAEKMMSGRR